MAYYGLNLEDDSNALETLSDSILTLCYRGFSKSLGLKLIQDPLKMGSFGQGVPSFQLHKRLCGSTCLFL
jgi:hypothetical protein